MSFASQRERKILTFRMRRIPDLHHGRGSVTPWAIRALGGCHFRSRSPKAAEPLERKCWAAWVGWPKGWHGWTSAGGGDDGSRGASTAPGDTLEMGCPRTRRWRHGRCEGWRVGWRSVPVIGAVTRCVAGARPGATVRPGSAIVGETRLP
ncbi:hypothetical protein FA95DRAFT_293418 [Auriscalpium vulgare]|uniref:Uncharacterized protein n=1 Tax=Auriscalpium vulgare TaxID=40419 RepID=A0ACB8RL70_9AGAM|nr:hypothetical protein FA95DRAFT_293418 [Auriscalpium vulgare]